MDIMAGNMVNMASHANETILTRSNTMAENGIKYLTDTFDNVRYIGGYCMATYQGNEGRLNDILDTFFI